MIRVALIGAGMMGKSHVRTVNADPNAEICAVCTTRLETAQPLVEMATSNAVAYDDYHKMLEIEKPDCVIINLPHHLHESSVKDCAEAGCHILLEKPMSVTYESCLRIIDICKKNNVLLQVAHPQNSMPQLRTCLDIIKSGKLGKVVMVQVHRSHTYYHAKRPKWFWKKETAGGGISINLGAHCLDIFASVAGAPIKSITGKCTYIDGMDVDASAQCFVEAENGVTGVVTLSGYNAARTESTIIHLTNGSIRLRNEIDLAISQNDSDWEMVDCDHYPVAFTHQWASFMEAMKTGVVTQCTGEYAANIIWAIEQLW